ncbi:MAG: alkene reductase, partial [Myxococcota bacterium]
ADAIGAERVGMRVSPYGVFNGTQGDFEGVHEQFVALAKALGELGLVYLHLVNHESLGAPTVPEEIKAGLREVFPNTFVLSGGYDSERAERDLAENKGDLVAFGRPFLANPDLLDRFVAGAELNDPKFDTFYTPGPEGYTDYPTKG